MTILTFLGTGRYNPVRYRWNDRECETADFGCALAKWFPEAQVLVAATPEARAHTNMSALAVDLGDRMTVLDIPNSTDSAQMWELYGILVEKLPRDEPVIIDITHGFRSTPMLVLMVVAYLRALKLIELQHLLYGSYEGRDAGGVAPVIDLIEFVQLLEWANAASQFTASGDAAPLADLIMRKQKSPLNPAREAMEELSENLLLGRPKGVREKAVKLVRAFDSLSPGEHDAPALDLIAMQIRDQFEPLANEERFQREIAQVQWYVDHAHYMHATALARELMVSAAIEADIGHKSADLEADIGHGSAETRSARDIIAFRMSEEGRKPAAERDSSWGRYCHRFWNVGDFRNDMNHCGHRENAMRPDKVVAMAKKLPGELQVALGWLKDADAQ